MAKIHQWYGRTGNNVLQVGNALVHAYYNRSVFSCPDHPLFNSFSIPFGYTPPASGWFFDVNPMAYGSLEQFKSLRLKLTQQFLLPRINLPPIPYDIQGLIDDGTVVAHARGGDVFESSPPSNYIQHPLDFYLHIAKNHSKVILVYEDEANPIVGALSANPSFNLISNKTLIDFSIFTQAKKIALGGVGTFVPSACLLNTNLSTIYFSNVAPLEPYLPFEMNLNKICINLEGYIPAQQWAATNFQKDLMLSYRLSIS